MSGSRDSTGYLNGENGREQTGVLLWGRVGEGGGRRREGGGQAR